MVATPVLNEAPNATRPVRPKGEVRPDTSVILPWTEYDLIVVAFSGGKDSVACLLEVLDQCARQGVARSRVEAWHQLVDGAPDSEHVWDWPVTDSYCAAVCRTLGVTYRRQWREGGLTAELQKTDARTRASVFELPDGTRGSAGGTSGTVATRGRHPSQSADLRTRWCSPVAKIDVCASAICHDPRLHHAKVLFITGERRQESSNRATYATVERGRGTNNHRRVDHFRIVLEWSEQQVWDRLKAARIRPHPAYACGFSRCSCLTCIFNGKNEWATVREIAPRQFAWHAAVEATSGSTIRKGLTVIGQADSGTAFTIPPGIRELATGTQYPDHLVLVAVGEEWVLPAGAFRQGCGPT